MSNKTKHSSEVIMKLSFGNVNKRTIKTLMIKKIQQYFYEIYCVKN